MLLAFGAHPDDIEFACGGVIACETRARRKAHLTKLFPKAKITETPKRDYRWRVSVPPLYMADLVAKHIIGIDYGNFKDSVKEDALHDMYSLWWGDHHRYQTDRHRQKWG